MPEGWILLHRKLQECQIWDNSHPFDMRSAWIDLLLLANHRDVEILFDYEPITVKRGQYLTSIRKLCERWSWSKNRVLKYLRLLENLQMIKRDSNTKRTLITIVKYEFYQDVRNTNEDSNEDTGIDTYKNGGVDTGVPQTKNEKNEKNEKEYICSFDEFWKCYPRKQDKGQAYKQYLARLNDGYTEEELLTACKNYAAECEKEKREQKYIKHGKTFLSINEPFKDYLGGNNGSGSQVISRTDEEQRNAEIDEHIRRIEAGEIPDERPFADMS